MGDNFDDSSFDMMLEHDLSDAEYDDILGREDVDLSGGTQLDETEETDGPVIPPAGQNKNKKLLKKKPVKKKIRSSYEPDDKQEEEPGFKTMSEPGEDYHTEEKIAVSDISTETYGGNSDMAHTVNYGMSQGEKRDDSLDFHNVMTSAEFFDAYEQNSPGKVMKLTDDDGDPVAVPCGRKTIADHVILSAGETVIDGNTAVKDAVVIPKQKDVNFNSYTENTVNNHIYDGNYQKTDKTINPFAGTDKEEGRTFCQQSCGMPSPVVNESVQMKTSSGIQNITANEDGSVSINSQSGKGQETTLSKETVKKQIEQAERSAQNHFQEGHAEAKSKLPVGMEVSSKPTSDHVLTDAEKEKLGREDNKTQKAVASDQEEKRSMDRKASVVYRRSISQQTAENFAIGAGMAIVGTITKNADPNESVVVVSNEVKKVRYGVLGQAIAVAGARCNLQAYKNHCSEINMAVEKVDSLFTEQKLTANDFRSKESLRQKLDKLDVHGQHSILKNRQEIADVLMCKEAFIRRETQLAGLFDEKQKAIINSNNLYSTKYSKVVQDITFKYLHNSPNATLRALEGNISISHLKQILKNADQYGLNPTDKAMIRRLIANKGYDAANSKLRMAKSGFKHAVMRSVERMDQNLQETVKLFRTMHRAVRVSKSMITGVYHTGRFIGKVTGLAYVEHIVARTVKKKTAEIKNVAKQKVKSSKPAKKLDETKKKTAEKVKNSAPVKSANKVNNAYKTKVEHLKNSKAGKTAQKTVSGARKAGHKVKTAGSTIKNVVSKPFAAIGKFFSVLGKVKMVVLLAIALPILAAVSLYLNLLFLDMIIMSVTDAIVGAGENVIFVDDNDDLKGWAHEIQLMDTERYDKAVEVGEGPPINPEVLEDHYIEHYGSPDKEKGYTIYYIDAYGNEIANKTTNAKDILCMAAVMFQNDIADNEEEFHDLVMDLYELMNPEVEYEESEIYTCLYGCDVFPYHCNCLEDYELHDKYVADGCGEYEEMMPYNEEGCETETEMADIESVDTSEWEEEDFYDEYGMPIMEVPVEIHYCPGHETPICYGHKDLDIYITIYDKEYAYAENLYPEDWESKSYARFISDFVSRGGWLDEDRSWCDQLFENDWFDTYGFDIEGGAGFTVGEVLSNRDIAEIEATFNGDVSEARRQIVTYALEYVGRIPYYWGGKATSKNYDENNFGSSVKADYKGRSAKGLDCSGFVQWVYWCVLDDKLPGSTAGYAGKYTRIGHSSLQPGDLGFADIPGAKNNHVGIYAGQDEDGNDYWVHCNSSAGNVSYNQTNCFHYYLRVLP